VIFIYLKQIIKLTRMPIVLAVLPIFFIGVLFALRSGASFSLVNFLWGFCILFIIEIAASFANDYYDYEADKNNRQFGFSGGSGVLLDYPELLPFAKWTSIMMFTSLGYCIYWCSCFFLLVLYSTTASSCVSGSW
jgi:1,4-dihydroxy-2-naphthoate octaprenyltransferase